MAKSHQELAALDKQFLWHPFTQMKDWLGSEPVIIESGKGAMLRDTQGREYLDGVSSLWCNVFGHRRREIDDAIKAQLDKIAHTTMLGLGSAPAIELAERLVRIAPKPLNKVFYSDSGSEAVEIALKIAFQYWQHRGEPARTKFIALDHAYHGDTIGAVSVGGVPLFHSAYKTLLFDVLRAPAPYCFRCSLGLKPATCGLACAKKADELLESNRGAVAGVVVEPLIQGAGGMIAHPRGYLAELQRLCRKHGTLLICDEVLTGFGRTGRMFACEHEDVVPDLMAVAKGITGGYLPLAATLATSEIYEAFLGDYSEFKTFFHGHTHTGNALCCAAAIATLDIFERERVIERIQPRIAQLTRRLNEFRSLTHAGDVRQCGLIAGVELMKDVATKRDYELAERVGIRVMLAARERGLITRPLGNVIVIMPPLSITENELDRMMDILLESIKMVTEQGK